MKLSTLDVLIITSLAQKPRYSTWENVPPVILARSVFDTHSRFVKSSPLFDVQVKDQTVSISVARYYRQPGPTTPGQDFAKKCSYWRSMYRQDRLLPFAENGFGAIRLAENAELFSSLLFNPERSQRHIYWDLLADKCYINGKEQPGNGLRWAWDIFAVSQIADRECELAWSKFGPHLDSPQPPHIIELSFNADVGASDSPAYIPNGQSVLYCALGTRKQWAISCGPVKWVIGSQRVTISRHAVPFTKKEGKAFKLLRACMQAQIQGEILTIYEAFEAICGEQTTTYRPNFNPTKGRKQKYGVFLRDDIPEYDEKRIITDKKQLKIITDARDIVVKKLRIYSAKHDLPFEIKLNVSQEDNAVELIIYEL